MSTDKKVLRKRRAKKGSQEEEEKLTKDETEVAKFLRWNLKTKKSSMFGDEVFYFTGSKIVDLMLDSKWATGKAKKSTIEFTDRDSTYFILDKMIALGLFSRVHRIYKEKEKKNKDKKDDKKKNKEDNGEDNGKEVKDSPRSKRKEKQGKDETAKEEKDPKEGKKKKKVKVSLEPHEHNIFLDSDDAVFIWIYDPVHPKTFFLGILLVIGAVAVCLFPLWPESFRVYSWYLSVAAMVFVGVILFLAIFRYILFCLLWGLTIGKLKFWLLPNLTADCGFVESFVPVYEYTLESGKDETEKQTEEDELNDDDADNKENEKEANDIEQEEKEKQEDEGKLHTASKDKDIDVKKEENEERAQNSGSNKETDDGEPWVKVSKSDAENGKSEKTDC